MRSAERERVPRILSLFLCNPLPLSRAFSSSPRENEKNPTLKSHPPPPLALRPVSFRFPLSVPRRVFYRQINPHNSRGACRPDASRSRRHSLVFAHISRVPSILSFLFCSLCLSLFLSLISFSFACDFSFSPLHTCTHTHTHPFLVHMHAYARADTHAHNTHSRTSRRQSLRFDSLRIITGLC